MDMDALIDVLYVKVRERLMEMGYLTPEGCLPETRRPPEYKKKLLKRVVTEKDVKDAWEESVTCIVTQEKAIVTDLAKEFAGKKNIRLVGEGKDGI